MLNHNAIRRIHMTVDLLVSVLALAEFVVRIVELVRKEAQ